MHVLQAIACHMLSIDMLWGATSKEAENTTSFEEVPKILQKFKFTFVFCFVMIAVMMVLSRVRPVGRMVQYGWQITYSDLAAECGGGVSFFCCRSC